MATASLHKIVTSGVVLPWHGFNTGLWQKEINVRDFIQQNYEPYEGDESFLVPATERTKKLWHRLTDLFWKSEKKECSTFL